MADDEATAVAEREQSWTESVTDWVEETYEDRTGSAEAPAEEGPIPVPYTEPTDDEKAQMQQQAALSDHISTVCNALQGSVEHVRQQASTLSADVASTSHDECAAVAAQCYRVSGEGYSSAARLLAAGAQDWVNSVKACNEVGYWVGQAAGHATAAASSDTDTIMGMNLNTCENELSNAVSSISKV